MPHQIVMSDKCFNGKQIYSNCKSSWQNDGFGATFYAIEIRNKLKFMAFLCDILWVAKENGWKSFCLSKAQKWQIRESCSMESNRKKKTLWTMIIFKRMNGTSEVFIRSFFLDHFTLLCMRFCVWRVNFFRLSRHQRAIMRYALFAPNDSTFMKLHSNFFWLKCVSSNATAHFYDENSFANTRHIQFIQTSMCSVFLSRR